MEWRYAPACSAPRAAPRAGGSRCRATPTPAAPPTGSRCSRACPSTRSETVRSPRARDEPRVRLVAGAGRRRPALTVAGTHLSFVPGPNVGQLRALQRHLDERAAAPPPAGRPQPVVAGRAAAVAPRLAAAGPRGPSETAPWVAGPLVQLDHVLAAGASAALEPGAGGSSAVPPPTTKRWWSSWSGADVPTEAPSLVPLSRGQLATARHLLPPERPGPMIAQHLLGTGNGSCLADRWPAPRALLVETGGNWTLAGDRARSTRPPWLAGSPGSSRPRPRSRPLLRAAVRELHEWPRVVLVLEAPGDPPPDCRSAAQVRRLGPGDAGSLAGLWRGDGLDRQHLGRPRGTGRQRHPAGARSVSGGWSPCPARSSWGRPMGTWGWRPSPASAGSG